MAANEGTPALLNQAKKRQNISNDDRPQSSKRGSKSGSNKYKKKPRRYEGEPSRRDRSVLWLGGLCDLKEVELMHYFSQYGHIRQVSITERNGAIGFGSVKFQTPAEVQLAIQGGVPATPGLRWCAEHTIGDVVVACNKSKLVSATRMLFVFGIKTLTTKQLKLYFSQYGEIEFIKVVRNQAPYGHIKFKSPISCAEAFKRGQQSARQREKLSTHFLDGFTFSCQFATSNASRGVKSRKQKRKEKNQLRAQLKREKKRKVGNRHN